MGRKGEGVLAAKELLDEAGTVAVKEGDTRGVLRLCGRQRRCFTTRVAGGPGAAQPRTPELGGSPDGVVVKETGGYRSPASRAGRGRSAPIRRWTFPVRGSGGSTSESAPRSGSRSTGKRVATSSSPAGPCWKRRRNGNAGGDGDAVEGMVMKGTVTAVREFGAFVSIPAPSRADPPFRRSGGSGWRISKAFSPWTGGRGRDHAPSTGRTGASPSASRRPLSDPWETAVDRFPAGSRHVGKVARLARLRGLRLPRRGSRRPAPHIETRRGKRIPERGRGSPRGAGDRSEGRLGRPREAASRPLLPASESPDTPEEEAEDYAKYLAPPPASPGPRFPGGSPQGENRAEREVTPPGRGRIARTA